MVSAASIVLTAFRHRHWQCSYRGARRILVAQLIAILVASHVFLHYLHHVRVDDPALPSYPAAHLHFSLCLVLGIDRFTAVSLHLLRLACHPSRLSGRRGSSFRPRSPI